MASTTEDNHWHSLVKSPKDSTPCACSNFEPTSRSEIHVAHGRDSACKLPRSDSDHRSRFGTVQQRNPEMAAAPVAALSAERASLCLDCPPSDGEAEPSPWLAVVAAPKRLEDHTELVLRNTRARIANVNGCPR